MYVCILPSTSPPCVDPLLEATPPPLNDPCDPDMEE